MDGGLTVGAFALNTDEGTCTLTCNAGYFTPDGTADAAGCTVCETVNNASARTCDA